MANQKISQLTPATSIAETNLLELSTGTTSPSGQVQDVSGLYSGNYGGSAPGFTPKRAVALAIDTSDGTIYKFYSGTWH